MPPTWLTVLQFLFIVAVPIAVVAGGVVSLFAVGALFDALDNPEELQQRIEAAFRRPPKAPRGIGKDHYYRPFWVGR
jgi:hypothetical protein